MRLLTTKAVHKIDDNEGKKATAMEKPPTWKMRNKLETWESAQITLEEPFSRAALLTVKWLCKLIKPSVF